MTISYKHAALQEKYYGLIVQYGAKRVEWRSIVNCILEWSRACDCSPEWRDNAEYDVRLAPPMITVIPESAEVPEENKDGPYIVCVTLDKSTRRMHCKTYTYDSEESALVTYMAMTNRKTKKVEDKK